MSIDITILVLPKMMEVNELFLAGGCMKKFEPKKIAKYVIISLFLVLSAIISIGKGVNIKAGQRSIGGGGKIPVPIRQLKTGSEATAWVMNHATIFLLQPFKLPTMAQKDGRKNTKAFQNVVPGYTDLTVAFFPLICISIWIVKVIPSMWPGVIRVIVSL